MNKPNKHIALLLIIIALCFNLIGQQCNIIYVSTNGTDSGIVGTQDNPSSLFHAFNLLSSTNKTIYINRSVTDENSSGAGSRFISTLTVMEVAG